MNSPQPTLDVYYWTTPNGHKITIALEELGVPYNLKPINIGKGEQFAPEFLQISPNNRIPALVDHTPKGGAVPLALFESGAILLYLAEKYGRFLSENFYARWEITKWLFWQVGGLGPMVGQNHHFVQFAPEKISYAIKRYASETHRLYGVMERRLQDSEYLGGDYSIADMACYPWVAPWEKQQQNIDEFPQVKRWLAVIAKRPAVIRAYNIIERVNRPK